MPLNTALRGLPDRATATSVELRYADGVTRHVGRVCVRWPFVTFKTTHNEWNVTHAPTGRHVRTQRTKAAAVSLIAQLTSVADWDVTSRRKARIARRAAAHLLPRVTRLA